MPVTTISKIFYVLECIAYRLCGRRSCVGVDVCPVQKCGGVDVCPVSMCMGVDVCPEQMCVCSGVASTVMSLICRSVYTEALRTVHGPCRDASTSTIAQNCTHRPTHVLRTSRL